MSEENEDLEYHNATHPLAPGRACPCSCPQDYLPECVCEECPGPHE